MDTDTHMHTHAHMHKHQEYRRLNKDRVEHRAMYVPVVLPLQEKHQAVI